MKKQDPQMEATPPNDQMAPEGTEDSAVDYDIDQDMGQSGDLKSRIDAALQAARAAADQADSEEAPDAEAPVDPEQAPEPTEAPPAGPEGAAPLHGEATMDGAENQLNAENDAVMPAKDAEIAPPGDVEDRATEGPGGEVSKEPADDAEAPAAPPADDSEAPEAPGGDEEAPAPGADQEDAAPPADQGQAEEAPPEGQDQGEAPQEAPEGQEGGEKDPKARLRNIIGQALIEVHEALPKLEAMKNKDPEVYKAVFDAISAMLDLAKEVLGPGQVPEGPEGAEEAPAPEQAPPQK